MEPDRRDELKQVVRQVQTHIRLLRSFGVKAVAAAEKPMAQKPVHMDSDPVSGPMGDPAMHLQELQSRIGQCTRCPLSSGRKNVVFGQGDPRASLVLVGEGPGQEEDRTGRPFVGEAGQLLEKILKAMGLSREQVYICNVVKCRPPKNRVPTDEEMSTCGRFLNEQLAIIKPRHILALGTTAGRFLLDTHMSIGKLRGRFFTHALTGAKVMPTYHPAYLLRNESAKRPVWDDVRQVMADMEHPRRSLDHERD